MQLATKYLKRGWPVLPLKPQSKQPRHKGWTKRTYTADEFKSDDNVGLNSGNRFGDVDLDNEFAREFAPHILPPTAIFGRESSPRSHYLYKCQIGERRIYEDADGMVLEIRAGKHQTMLPGSTHPTGEEVRWYDECDPVELDAETLERLTGLLFFVATIAKHYPRQRGTRDEVAMAFCGALLDAGLDADTVDAIVVRAATLAGDEEAEKRAKAARTKAQQDAGGWTTGRTRLIELLGLDQTLGKKLIVATNSGLMLDKNEPRCAARAFLKHRPPLINFQERWLSFDGVAYKEISEKILRADLYDFLEGCFQAGEKPRPFCPSQAKVSNILDSVESLTVDREALIPPCWIGDTIEDSLHLVPVRNGLLHLPSGRLAPGRPDFFTLSARQFDFDASADCPRFMQFLEETWPSDEEAQMCAQEWAGYVLTPDVSLQKALAIIGVLRSGKGLFLTTLSALAGEDLTAWILSSGMNDTFGLEPLLGKNLAAFDDVRIDDRAASLMEPLLSISGGAPKNVKRKGRTEVTTKITAKFVFTSNLPPKFADPSGVAASRFVTLPATVSKFGREDTELESKLREELSGILNWARIGWLRLQQNKAFTIPSSSADLAKALKHGSAEIFEFMEEECVDVETLADYEESYESRADLWDAWLSWCAATNTKPGSRGDFYRTLEALGYESALEYPHGYETEPSKPSDRRRAYRGIRLRPVAERELRGSS